MKAKEAVIQYGKDLIGKYVHTSPMGDYPGGLAKVIEIAPDPAAPEIVFQVEHPAVDPIGVFEHESVVIYDSPVFFVQLQSVSLEIAKALYPKYSKIVASNSSLAFDDWDNCEFDEKWVDKWDGTHDGVNRVTAYVIQPEDNK